MGKGTGRYLLAAKKGASVPEGGSSKTLLKKPTLNPSMLDSYQPISNIPFLDKVLKHVMKSNLNSKNYLDYLGICF